MISNEDSLNIECRSVSTNETKEYQPEKSLNKYKARYYLAYENLKRWCARKDVSITEDVLLEYFLEKSKTLSRASLSSEYCMLKLTISVEKGQDISKFNRLKEFLKRQKDDQTPKSQDKSKIRYYQVYENFTKWCATNDAFVITEDVLLKFFVEKSKTLSPATLWSEYSMLKLTISMEKNQDISKFNRLREYLKKKNDGYQPRKSQVFTNDEISRFLKEAPDEIYLLKKVVAIFGIAGACRTDELYNLKVSDVEHENFIILVKSVNTKNNSSRTFVVTEDWVPLVHRYMQLRPKSAQDKRFFYRYERGKCVNQVVGKHTLAKIPYEMAKYLKIPNPNQFTGHSFRRTSSMLSANDTGDDTLGLKKHGDLKSSTVAEDISFIEMKAALRTRLKEAGMYEENTSSCESDESDTSPENSQNVNEKVVENIDKNVTDLIEDSDQDLLNVSDQAFYTMKAFVPFEDMPKCKDAPLEITGQNTNEVQVKSEVQEPYFENIFIEEPYDQHVDIKKEIADTEETFDTLTTEEIMRTIDYDNNEDSIDQQISLMEENVLIKSQDILENSNVETYTNLFDAVIKNEEINIKHEEDIVNEDHLNQGLGDVSMPAVELGFSKANSSNLPKVDLLTIMDYFYEHANSIFVEIRRLKSQPIIGRNCYEDNTIGYVQVQPKLFFCEIKACITPENDATANNCEVWCRISTESNVVEEVACQSCPGNEGGCIHCVAFLMWLHRRSAEPSPTKEVNYWKKSELEDSRTRKNVTTNDYGKRKVSAEDSVPQEHIQGRKKRKIKDNVIDTYDNSEVKMLRFGVLNEEEIDENTIKSQPKNTVKSKTCIWNQFMSFCAEKKYTFGQDTPICELASILKSWASNMRKKNGEEYKVHTVKVLWNVTAKLLMEKYFNDYKIKINPFEQIEFKAARDAKNAKRRHLQAIDGKRKESTTFLTYCEFQKLIAACDELTPDGLQKKVFFLLSYELAWRGGEGARTEITSFKEETDNTGVRRIEYNPVFSKTPEGSVQNLADSKWLVPNEEDPCFCPIRTFLRFRERRKNITNTRLFINPNPHFKISGNWYNHGPVGVNVISRWTKIEAEKLGFGRANKITNGSLRIKPTKK